MSPSQSLGQRNDRTIQQRSAMCRSRGGAVRNACAHQKLREKVPRRRCRVPRRGEDREGLSGSQRAQRAVLPCDGCCAEWEGECVITTTHLIAVCRRVAWPGAGLGSAGLRDYGGLRGGAIGRASLTHHGAWRVAVARPPPPTRCVCGGSQRSFPSVCAAEQQQQQQAMCRAAARSRSMPGSEPPLPPPGR